MRSHPLQPTPGGIIPTQHHIRYGEIYGRHGPDRGMANLISYDVRMQHEGGSTVYRNVTPTHRRPSDDTEIVAAQKGDVVVIQFRSINTPSFLILEGLVTQDCTNAG